MAEGARGIRWLAGHVGGYAVGCLAAWTVGALLFAPDAPIPSLLTFVLFYGFLFGIPTVIALVALYAIGRRAPVGTFRAAALIVLPLIAVVLPVEVPPSELYGIQLLVQFPVQVALAVAVRPPAPRAAATPTSIRPSRSWYVLPVWLGAWVVLVVAGSGPLLGNLLPSTVQEPASPVAGPAEHVSFSATGGHFVLYQRYEPPTGSGEWCRYGQSYSETRPTHPFQGPPGELTYQGQVYRYLGEVSGADGTFDISCNTGPILVTRYLARPSPLFPVIIVTVSVAVLGLIPIALARRGARRRTPVTPAAAVDRELNPTGR